MNGAWAALLAVALITTGCLVPAVGHKVISGTEIRPEQLAFIEDGVTTRGEITERFGEPWAWYPDLHVCVYFWETASGYWVYGFAYDFKAAIFADEIGRLYVLFIHFDEEDHARRYEILRHPNKTTTKDFAQQWLQRQ
jgi:hypothetical protein